VESLITINKKLGQPEAALGILKYAQKKLGSEIVVKESWLAKLGNWSEALGLYEERARKAEEEGGEEDLETILGMMKCWDALGRWGEIVQLCQREWERLMGNGEGGGREGGRGGRQHVQKKVINLAAHACWKLGQWNGMEHFLRYMEDDVVDTAFYRAILALHNEDFEAAAVNIDHARRLLDTTFTALVSESYNRAYMSMVQFQQLAEMEEIIAFRRLAGRQLAGRQPQQPLPVGCGGGGGGGGALQLPSAGGVPEGEDVGRAKQLLLEKWKRRLQGCRSDLSVWQRVLSVRSLILRPTDHVQAWLQFAALCLQSKNFSLAEKVLTERLALHSGGGAGNGGVGGLGVGSGRGSDTGLLFPDGPEHGRRLPGGATFSASMLKMGSDGGGRSFPSTGSGRGIDPLASTRYEVQFAYLKYTWALGKKDETLQRLSQMVARLSPQDMDLQVRCLLKLGDWELARLPLGSSLGSEVFRKVSEAYATATQLDASNYKAWHAWALVNFHMMEEITVGQVPFVRSRKELSRSGEDPSRPGVPAPPASSVPVASSGASFSHSREQQRLLSSTPEVAAYNLAAAQGFLRAISLGRRRWCASVQQDLLCLLTVWFRYGNDPELHRVLASGFNLVSLDSWLGVLPQLIARIHTREGPVRFLLDDLLSRLGSRHPQALVYPLSVALKSPKHERKSAAEALMSTLRQHYSSLVEEALLVSGEMIRVAILWHEQWHEGLEESSRLYFGDGNVKAMLETLVPLHQHLEAGPTTLREAAFQQAFGRELAQAYSCIKRYQDLLTRAGMPIPVTGGFVRPGGSGQTAHASAAASSTSSFPRQQSLADAEAALNQAWDLYYSVFRRINKQLPSLTSLDLQYVSPALLGARNLELAVPGTYRVNSAGVRIAFFHPAVQVISSKQRPRKVTIQGEDGQDYLFLLKGHEDLRQDERVMQLFGLVNALLARDRRTNKHDLSIQRYAVTPLSHNVGIVGWVPHCDTLHALIRDYREARKVMLGIEHRLMLQMSPDYEALPLMHKVEVFEAALENTAGQDLYKVLWLKSENSEIWLDRRTSYTRSLAVMSMVGYILGLGDRHPSNLMLDRYTGKILHIDFGDCFEVAMHREKYPEKIPFRLTRMLTNAMEISGIEGNFRCTCERVMTVLRDNRDSLIAMLEAFVHDPLISWRLLGGGYGNPEEGGGEGGKGGPSGPSEVVDGVEGGMERLPMEEEEEDGEGHGEGGRQEVWEGQREPAVGNSDLRMEGTMDEEGGGRERGRDGGSETQTLSWVATPLTTNGAEPAHVRYVERKNVLATVSEGPGDGGGATRGEEEGDEELKGVEGGANGKDGARGGGLGEKGEAGGGGGGGGRGGRAPTPSEQRSRMTDLHLEIGSLAASLSANKTRFSSSVGVPAHSLAQSRLDHRSAREKELVQAVGPEGMEAPAEVLNEKALAVIRRVQDKLTGLDFDNETAMDVAEQVERLVEQATSKENLCQCFIGYCPFW
jgi:FKBP12-rapamycin complex-associated protein